MPYIDWLGKDDVVHHHKEIPYKTISCQEIVGDEESDNLIIKGDNLLALKSLLPYYANAVKMIYIDPPYNTGNTSWVYNDNMDSPLIKKWLNDTVNAEDLSRSDKWLCMMYPRLKLLRELLKEDGVIFISIDDAEVAHLRMICDEIFGAENFITEVIWERAFAPKNDAKYFSVSHDYILVYAKKIDKFKINRLGRSDEANDRYKNLDNDSRGIWISDNLTVRTYSEKNDYPIITPSGRIVNPAEGRCWGVSEDKFQKLVEENRIWFGHEGNNVPRLKRFLSDVQDGMVPISLWKHGEVGHNQEAKQESNRVLFGKTLFETPKPVRLIQRILQLSTSSNDIILDSFAGSGTTAHAVIEQNRVDGGNRKFILIETLDYAKEITAERVKRVQQGYAFTGKDKTTLFEKTLTTTQLLNAKGMQKLSEDVAKLIENEKANYTKIEKTFKDNTLKVIGIKDIKEFKEGLGGGFKYCELGVEIFDEVGELNSSLTFDDIAKHIYFVEFKQPLAKKSASCPYVGSYKKQHLYFYEERFKILDMKKLIKEHDEYKELIVYTRKSTISNDELKKHKIAIRYIPYDIKDN
jgi:adenine-specific DNA-methyltransferase